MSDDPTVQVAGGQVAGEMPPPDVVQAIPVEAFADGSEAGQETITEPAKLLRIASMVRELLEETRQT